MCVLLKYTERRTVMANCYFKGRDVARFIISESQLTEYFDEKGKQK